ncbi:hypothetical protein MUP38_08285 [Candidatus Bathyarchaeota archaeon]|nr:hypothetical protein [Candidatus Bathyarchaeota archaeon]
MRDVGEDEVLFRESFMEQVLNCGVHVSCIIGSYDFLGKLRQQRGWNIMKSQVQTSNCAS